MRKEDVLNKYYGFSQLKSEQEKIIDMIMEEKDVIGLLPTGYGKSVTFQVPAMMLEGITIVITPLIALMQDQVISLKRKNLPAECINSLQDKKVQDEIYEKIKNKEIKILYVSAERLLVEKFVSIIMKVDVDLVVCDEAHTLIWSEDFREALGKIPEFISKLPYRPRMLALTATATDISVKKINKLMGLNNPKIIAIDCDRDNIFYNVIETHDKNRDLFFYCERRKKVQGIVYCLTIRHVEYVYSFLKQKGFNTFMYHGMMSKDEKNINSNEFSKCKSGIMVASNAYGMGIDIPTIRYVVDYDMPASIEDFLQQSGRASRDGAKAESIVFYNDNDIKTITYFIEHIESTNKSNLELARIRKERYDKMNSMVNFCLSKKCLHKICCTYLGVKHSGKCGMCRNCKK